MVLDSIFMLANDQSLVSTNHWHFQCGLRPVGFCCTHGGWGEGKKLDSQVSAGGRIRCVKHCLQCAASLPAPNLHQRIQLDGKSFMNLKPWQAGTLVVREKVVSAPFLIYITSPQSVKFFYKTNPSLATTIKMLVCFVLSAASEGMCVACSGSGNFFQSSISLTLILNLFQIYKI